MASKLSICRILLLLTFMVCGVFGYAQNSKQKALETRRQELRREIKKINELRVENKSKEQSQLSLIEDFNYKNKCII